LTLSLLAHLSSITLPSIRSLSNSGAKQLEADLDYLSNAVRALDVEWEELEKWKEGVGLSVDELRQKARSGVDRSVLDKITRMKEKPT
jgi:predicted  nucleic acid-binding Zn-ribbon protein